jgi:hypothetical protein
VLGDPTWLERMGANERRAMTPLFWGHVNPYGTFQLDMTARLPLDSPMTVGVAGQLLLHGVRRAGSLATLHLVTRMLVLGHLAAGFGRPCPDIPRNSAKCDYRGFSGNHQFRLAVTMNIGPLVLTNIGPPPGV